MLFRLNLEKNVEQFQYWADKFEMLPMYFMCFYGAQNINTVIEVSASSSSHHHLFSRVNTKIHIFRVDVSAVKAEVKPTLTVN